MRLFFLIQLLSLVILIADGGPAWAADAGYSLRQLDHTAWTLRDGAPPQIFAIAQTQDGFLWLGTANGLFRFDGVKFELFQPTAGQHLPKASVQSLLAMPDGGLWIGYTLGGTSFLKNGVLEDHDLLINHRGGTVWYMVSDPDGDGVWAACTTGLSHFFGNAWHDVARQSGFDAISAYRVFFDKEQTLWVVTDDVLYKKPHGSGRFENTGLDARSNASFELGVDGTVYLNDAQGVLTLDQLAKKPSQRHYLLRDDSLVEIRLDERAIWALSTQIGIKRLADVADGSLPAERPVNLTSARASASLKDREGTVWIATAGGLDRFRRFALDPAPLPETFGHFALAADDDGSILVGTEGDGLNRMTQGRLSRIAAVAMDRITCLVRGPDGKLWIGGQPGLGYFQNGRYVALPLPAEIATSNGDTQAMAIAQDGSLWLQSMNNGPLMRFNKGAWSTVGSPDRMSAVTMALDHRGRIWSGYLGGLIVIYDGSQVTQLRPGEWAGVGNVTALQPSGEDMWIGGERGLGIFSGKRALVVRFAGDVPIGGISGIYRQADGSLWVNSLPGIVRISADEVTHARQDPAYAMHYRLFNNLDGLKGKAPQMRPLPSIVRGSDGLLWFSTTNGVVSIDPDNIPSNAVVPPVAITAVLAGSKAREWTGTVVLPKGSDGLELRYTALSMAIPERVQFRYQLEGYDKEWQDAGERRQAFYPHLPPGHYVFKVTASNNDGLWNRAGASLPITLPPTFLQSVYFKTLLVAIGLLLFWMFYLWRLRQATVRVRTRLFERFSERERIARDLHDTFFQGIQGLILSIQSAARRLPAQDPVRVSLERTLEQSDEVMLKGRQLVLDLRTQATEVHELGEALGAAGSAAAQGSPATFRMTVDGEATALNSLVSEELYKLGCEAINNAFRHAGASLIEVEIQYGKSELSQCVRDDGRGIATAVLDRGGLDNHFGLPGMRERAKSIGAVLDIRNRTGGGVEVRVKVPARLAYRPRRGR